MALNKQDYYNDGRDMARALIVAGAMVEYTTGYPLQDLGGKPLNVSMNGSWQAVAWRQGFDDMRLEWRGTQTVRDFEANGDPSMGIPPSGGFIKGEMVVMTANTGAGKSRLRVAQSARQTAMCHLESLYVEIGVASASDNTRRADRILSKTRKLTTKWGF